MNEVPNEWRQSRNVCFYRTGFLLINLFFFLVLISCRLGAQESSPPKCISVEKAGVATAELRASEAGKQILLQGGNAADAATAVAMALAVVYPQAGNLGGGGFLVYRSQSGEVYVLDFRETAPQAASHNMYLNAEGEVQSEKSRIGGLAVGVPGTVRGFYQFHEKYGNLPWNMVLQPAIRLAEDGFVVSRAFENSLNEERAKLERFPETRAIFLPDGKLPTVGDQFYQEHLARTLKAIALHGDNAFYNGEIAREIVKAIRENGGVMSLDDLENYRAVEREPIVIEYRGYKIYAVPPPSSGGVVLGGILNSLQFVDFKHYPFHSARQIALFADLEKRYYALRNQFLGDPDFVQMPLERMLSTVLAKSILEQINIRHPIPAAEISAEKLLAAESNQTTHFSVMDSLQNAVSVTYTLNGSYGSKLVAGSTGILLNNEMDDFAAKPGSPNMYQLVQGEANAIAPGKRMLSSMTPVVVTRGDSLMGLLGSPGGPRIITTVLQVLVNLIDYRMSLQQAVEAGRFHDQWLPDSIYYEADKFDSANLQTLEHWGYNLVKRDRIGDVQAIWRNATAWEVCSDPRGSGFPEGF
jgi:gamma-glutamyltranspeptidase / glutathione hydrolase